MSETVVFQTSVLKPHDRNGYYFDDMDGEKWQEFLKSIREHGVINPPVITEDGRIISGHQRVRACLELGIDEIECTIKHFQNEQEEEIALIESNLRQRGVINSPSVKLGRILTRLESAEGAEVNKPSGRFKIAKEARKDIYNRLHIDRKTACRARGMAGMPDKLQGMTMAGKLNATTAYEEIIKLPQEEQEALAERLLAGDSYTKAEIKAIIGTLPDEEKLKTLESRIIEAHQLKAENELKLRQKLKDAQQKERTAYEALQQERKAHRLTKLNCEKKMEKQESFMIEYLQQADAEIIISACKGLVKALQAVIERGDAITDTRAAEAVQEAQEALEAIRKGIEIQRRATA